MIKPEKKGNSQYSVFLRKEVEAKINEWLDNKFSGFIRYAIAIEETDAWVLTIFSDIRTDTAGFNNPKEKLEEVRKRKLSAKENKRLKQLKKFEEYFELSREFRKSKNLIKCSELNYSLKAFYESLL